MAWQWFAVKTLLRREASGKPITTQYPYDQEATLVEERIVIFKARNEREATKKAEREARRNLSKRYANMFGETIRHRFIKSFDVYPLDAIPGDGTEIFYLNRLISKDISDERVARKYIGESATRVGQDKRHKFLGCSPERRESSLALFRRNGRRRTSRK